MKALVLGLVLNAATAGSPTVPWEPWSDSAFARAAREKRFVLLEVGAVWCHWCHVMEATTYKDADVIRLIRDHYVPVRADADAQPDLANRYEEYGWPATIVLDASGRDLVKFRGYIAPQRMKSLLAGVIEDPTPGPSADGTSVDIPDSVTADLSAARLEELDRLVASRYDPENGGWGFVHKYLDAGAIEYSMRRAAAGDTAAERRARETLDKVRRHLIDPVWGGLYQYSHGGVWENPHFEKIMFFQAEGLRLYSLAYTRWRDPSHLQVGRDILRYMRRFLQSPSGAFFPSQDADVVRGEHSASYFALDDQSRLARGIPRVDPHLYTRETAWAIPGLLAYAAASGESSAREDALRAGRWILAERALGYGGFRHDAEDRGGPYLGDTVAGGRAFLSLFEATGDRTWLDRAQEAMHFIDRTFRASGIAGYLTAKPTHAVDRPRPQEDENVAVARLAAALDRVAPSPEWSAYRNHALKYLLAPAVARRYGTANVLLAAKD